MTGPGGMRVALTIMKSTYDLMKSHERRNLMKPHEMSGQFVHANENKWNVMQSYHEV